MKEFVLRESAWPSMPAEHHGFLAHALAVLRGVPTLCGLAAGGSFITGHLDRYSDLDLLLLVEEGVSPLPLASRQEIAARLGPLLVSFTGEHVNEPRLLICLYGPPALHVDLKFLPPSELNPRVEDPVVLWDRDDQVRRALARGAAAYPTPDLQWIEDRFWVWVHYGATKIGRGEVLEALDFLSAVRRLVLGPLVLQHAGARPDGVRRVERLDPALVGRLRSTVAACDPASCYRALEEAVALYREYRAVLAPAALVCRAQAELEAIRYLEDVGRLLGGGTSG